MLYQRSQVDSRPSLGRALLRRQHCDLSFSADAKRLIVLRPHRRVSRPASSTFPRSTQPTHPYATVGAEYALCSHDGASPRRHRRSLAPALLTCKNTTRSFPCSSVCPLEGTHILTPCRLTGTRRTNTTTSPSFAPRRLPATHVGVSVEPLREMYPRSFRLSVAQFPSMVAHAAIWSDAFSAPNTSHDASIFSAAPIDFKALLAFVTSVRIPLFGSNSVALKYSDSSSSS